MQNDNVQSIDLQQAQDLILGETTLLSTEEIGLALSLNRFPARSLVALESLPGYNQSLRDGYAITEAESTNEGEQGGCYRVIDEVAAGDTRQLDLEPGDAIRIMTGGLVPDSCVAVVPQESCRIVDGLLNVPAFFLGQSGLFIHRKGSELAKGQVVVPLGAAIRPEQQILLTGVGYDTVPVIRKPQVSFFCTGSELVTGTEAKPDGKKFSANSHLLHGLITCAGAELMSQQIVKDDPKLVTSLLTEMVHSKSDIIISTGGMGPGKFDLIEEAFLRAGGRVVYESLRLRPGKSTLFGILGNSLFFGMPGPPPAVHLLFNELILPAILSLQGGERCRPQKLKATLREDLHLSKRGLPRLKSGSLQIVDGRCLVRPVDRVEALNCHIHCPAARRLFRKGEKVTVHLLGSSSLG